MQNTIKLFSVFFLILFIVSCTNEQKKIQNLQVTIIKNANQINKDFLQYSIITDNIAKYAKSLLENHKSLNLDTLFIELKAKNPIINQLYYIDNKSFKYSYPLFDSLTSYEQNTNHIDLYYFLTNDYNNPSKKSIWINKPYTNTQNTNFVISSIAPIYVNNQIMGITGFDITVNNIYKQYLNNNLKYHSLILSSKGIVISSDKNSSKLLNIPDINNINPSQLEQTTINYQNNFDLMQHNQSEVATLTSKIIKGEKYFIASINKETYYILCENINLMDWILVYLVKK